MKKITEAFSEVIYWAYKFGMAWQERGWIKNDKTLAVVRTKLELSMAVYKTEMRRENYA